ncbi:hypothetical protein GMSM_12530 [Geomonas sp. Red276]
MDTFRNNRGRADAALTALAADGCFSMAFTYHLLTRQSSGLTLVDFLAMAFILCVLGTACWIIHHDHWHREAGHKLKVKTLRIRELEAGAAIEFDGKQYRVDDVDRSRGEIRITRVGRPGNIIVQIEGQS